MLDITPVWVCIKHFLQWKLAICYLLDIVLTLVSVITELCSHMFGTSVQTVKAVLITFPYFFLLSVSPPGGDFSDPVTSATLGIVQVRPMMLQLFCPLC